MNEKTEMFDIMQIDDETINKLNALGTINLITAQELQEALERIFMMNNKDNENL